MAGHRHCLAPAEWPHPVADVQAWALDGQLVGRSRPARPAGPQSQRATGEAWRNVPTTESAELRASSVTQSDAQASTASGTSFRTRALRRGAPAVASAGVRIARRYLWSYGPCSVARGTWTNKPRVNRCLPRHLHHRVALKNTPSVACLPMCRPPSSAAGKLLAHSSEATTAGYRRRRIGERATPVLKEIKR